MARDQRGTELAYGAAFPTARKLHHTRRQLGAPHPLPHARRGRPSGRGGGRGDGGGWGGEGGRRLRSRGLCNAV
eukprot:2106667-Rhodomonas_salina.1